MEQWQYWMKLGNDAYRNRQFALAERCFRQALFEAWPVWYHCAFIHCPTELTQEEASLPTLCLSIAMLNLAQTYQQQRRWQRCRSTLKQGLYWFEKMLSQPENEHPATLAVLKQSAKLRAHYQQLQSAPLKIKPAWFSPSQQALLH
mgnify:CR=1 FL=1